MSNIILAAVITLTLSLLLGNALRISKIEKQMEVLEAMLERRER